jgi:toxin HigB-1
MVKTIRHRGLRKLYEKDDRSGLNADHLSRIVAVMINLNVASRPRDSDMPGYHLHPLRGELKGFWSDRISGNYRIIFRMADGDVHDVDLVDYH